jgi:hypothetical protein
MRRSDLNYCYRRERALHELDADLAGFAWIDCADFRSLGSYTRADLDAIAAAPDPF